MKQSKRILDRVEEAYQEWRKLIEDDIEKDNDV